MKNIIMMFSLFLIISNLIFAEEFELGLISPIQYNGEKNSIDGLRIGLIYTKNTTVKGIDLNGIISNTTEKMDGIQIWGLVNYNEGDFEGVHFLNGINYTKGKTKGYSILSIANIDKNVKGGRFFSGFNFVEFIEGIDLGIVNIASDVKGFQFGVINYAKHLDGIQIGVINCAMNSSIFPVLPVFNISKKF